ncbi:hypothetical protein [Nocardioides speluncae]|uniref:hypothetical protein n=1 Tax=Nocardioides speluncae TaxID=2670337 RepID=UPI00197F8940|nr:hypothetical protein [Nocardioides speluncae]
MARTSLRCRRVAAARVPNWPLRAATRREGAALDRDIFDAVVAAAREFHDFG